MDNLSGNNQLSFDFTKSNKEKFNSIKDVLGTKVKQSVYTALRKKDNFEKIKVRNFNYKDFDLEEVEIANGVVRKIFLKNKNNEKYCLNIKNYKIKHYNDYMRNYDDDGEMVFVSDIDIPSYAKKTGTVKGEEVYGKLLKINSSNNLENFVSYVIKYFHEDNKKSLSKAA